MGLGLALAGVALLPFREQVGCCDARRRTESRQHSALLLKFRFCLPLLLLRPLLITDQCAALLLTLS